MSIYIRVAKIVTLSAVDTWTALTNDFKDEFKTGDSLTEVPSDEQEYYILRTMFQRYSSIRHNAEQKTFNVAIGSTAICGCNPGASSNTCYMIKGEDSANNGVLTISQVNDCASKTVETTAELTTAALTASTLDDMLQDAWPGTRPVMIKADTTPASLTSDSWESTSIGDAGANPEAVIDATKAVCGKNGTSINKQFAVKLGKYSNTGNGTPANGNAFNFVALEVTSALTDDADREIVPLGSLVVLALSADALTPKYSNRAGVLQVFSDKFCRTADLSADSITTANEAFGNEVTTDSDGQTTVSTKSHCRQSTMTGTSSGSNYFLFDPNGALGVIKYKDAAGSVADTTTYAPIIQYGTCSNNTFAADSGGDIHQSYWKLFDISYKNVLQTYTDQEAETSVFTGAATSNDATLSLHCLGMKTDPAKFVRIVPFVTYKTRPNVVFSFFVTKSLSPDTLHVFATNVEYFVRSKLATKAGLAVGDSHNLQVKIDMHGFNNGAVTVSNTSRRLAQFAPISDLTSTAATVAFDFAASHARVPTSLDAYYVQLSIAVPDFLPLDSYLIDLRQSEAFSSADCFDHDTSALDATYGFPWNSSFKPADNNDEIHPGTDIPNMESTGLTWAAYKTTCEGHIKKRPYEDYSNVSLALSGTVDGTHDHPFASTDHTHTDHTHETNAPHSHESSSVSAFVSVIVAWAWFFFML